MNLKEYLERIEKLILMSSKEVLTTEETALYLGVSVSRLNHLCCERDIPFYKHGQQKFFRKTEVEGWMTQSRVPSNADIDAAAATYLVTGKRIKTV